LLTVLSITQFACAPKQQSEIITEENYLKVDSAIWMQYERDMEKIYEYFEKYPEKRDSLRAAANQILAIASKKNIEAAIKFAAVPSGLQRLFMVRLDISKDTIYSVLKNLPDSMQTSPYGKSLSYHINSEQISEGSRYYDFQAVDTEGINFSLSSLEGKNILLLYGGLGCMGEVGRDFLNKVYRETSRDNFEIVVYCLNSSLENLQQERIRYSSEFILVSDFLQDHSPMKILYGAQAMPTCFFINQEGIVVMKTVGLHQERVSELLKEL
jgi:peroxiredoxin